jgi:glutamyl-tRNA reductase
MAAPETLFVASMNHRTAPVEVREQLALEEDKIREILADLAGGDVLDEVMIVSTCNRVEVYGVAAVPGEARSAAFGRLGSHRGLGWRDLEPLVYTATGDEAALHAFRVAASLDSMILGEPQILGQVKDAFALAQSAGTAGPILHALMSQAFGAAKRVRTETEVGRLALSVYYSSVVLSLIIF